MKRNYVFLTLFILLSIHLTAQDSLYKHRIKFSPVKLIDVVNPGISIAYEYVPGKNWGTQLSYTYHTNVIPYRLIKFNGYKFSLCEKYYIIPESKKRGRMYTAIEVVYGEITFRDSADFKPTSNYFDHQNRDDEYRGEKKNFILQGKFGYQKRTGRFIWEYEAGWGLKYREVQHFERKYPGREMKADFFPLRAFYRSHREGNYWTLTMPHNIRVGYIF